MTNTDLAGKDGGRHFMLSNDIFSHPEMDIYTQMAYIVLKFYSAESNIPELSDISKLGRMNRKEATKAMQRLVEHGILSDKLFQRIVGYYQDDRLSWTAKGLLSYCSERPNVQLSDLLELSSESGEDEANIRRALLELHQFGYLEEYPEWKRMAI